MQIRILQRDTRPAHPVQILICITTSSPWNIPYMCESGIVSLNSPPKQINKYLKVRLVLWDNRVGSKLYKFEYHMSSASFFGILQPQKHSQGDTSSCLSSPKGKFREGRGKKVTREHVPQGQKDLLRKSTLFKQKKSTSIKSWRFICDTLQQMDPPEILILYI